MRSRTVLIGLLVAAVAAVSAIAATTSRKDAAAAPPVPLLWKVSDGDNDLYLLGSFHLLAPEDYPLSADVDAAFEDAESLMFELSPEEMASPQTAAAMTQAAIRTDGKPLDDDLPKPMVRRLQDWTKKNAKILQATGMTGDALQVFEPWFAGLTISIVEMNKQGLDASLGLDNYFMMRARAAKKPAAGLEKASEQIALFDGMGMVEQLQFLDEALGEAGKDGSEIEMLHAAWRRGDDMVLWRSMGEDMRRQYPKLYRRVNVERNEAWVPKLQRLLDGDGTDDTLVVVGSMHLLGEDGVVEKLRAKGYRVERVCTGCQAQTSPGAKPARKR